MTVLLITNEETVAWRGRRFLQILHLQSIGAKFKPILQPGPMLVTSMRFCFHNGFLIWQIERTITPVLQVSVI